MKADIKKIKQTVKEIEELDEEIAELDEEIAEWEKQLLQKENKMEATMKKITNFIILIIPLVLISCGGTNTPEEKISVTETDMATETEIEDADVEDADVEAEDAEAEPVCKDGEVEIKGNTCGLNGRGYIKLTCSRQEWVPGDCQDPDECEDEKTADLPCGLNNEGVETYVCVLGKWEVSQECDASDICSNGDTKDFVCGINGKGTQEATCEGGKWVNTGECQDPDICSNNTTKEGGACGFNDNGTGTFTCTNGQWELAACDDPDECKNGEEVESVQAVTMQPDISKPKVTAFDVIRKKNCSTGQWKVSLSKIDFKDGTVNGVQYPRVQFSYLNFENGFFILMQYKTFAIPFFVHVSDETRTKALVQRNILEGKPEGATDASVIMEYDPERKLLYFFYYWYIDRTGWTNVTGYYLDLRDLNRIRSYYIKGIPSIYSRRGVLQIISEYDPLGMITYPGTLIGSVNPASYFPEVIDPEDPFKIYVVEATLGTSWIDPKETPEYCWDWYAVNNGPIYPEIVSGNYSVGIPKLDLEKVNAGIANPIENHLVITITPAVYKTYNKNTVYGGITRLREWGTDNYPLRDMVATVNNKTGETWVYLFEKNRDEWLVPINVWEKDGFIHSIWVEYQRQEVRGYINTVENTPPELVHRKVNVTSGEFTEKRYTELDLERLNAYGNVKTKITFSHNVGNKLIFKNTGYGSGGFLDLDTGEVFRNDNYLYLNGTLLKSTSEGIPGEMRFEEVPQ